MRRLPVVLHVVYKNDWSSAFLPGYTCVYLPTMTPRVKPPHTLVSVLYWLWYCRATALSALANLTLLLGKNTLPFPAFDNLNFVPPPHRRAYTKIPKSCPKIRFPHQQDFFPIRSVTKSSTARFSHENLVEKFKIFVQDFVPIRTALKWSEDVSLFVTHIVSQKETKKIMFKTTLRTYLPGSRLRFFIAMQIQYSCDHTFVQQYY